MDKIKKHRLLVFASGRGSNFEAIAHAIQNGQIPNAEILCLFSNKTSAPVLEKAKLLKISTHVIASKDYKTEGKFDRGAYEKDLIQFSKNLKPDWILLAGYMLLLGREFIQAFPGKIINIHPSLLPKYKGLEAQKQALLAKEKFTGCTVHIVTEEMDAGPILIQKQIEIREGDTVTTITDRLLPVEHAAYIEAVNKLTN